MQPCKHIQSVPNSRFVQSMMPGPRVTGYVISQHHIFQFEQRILRRHRFAFKHIQPGGRQLAGSQRCNEC